MPVPLPGRDFPSELFTCLPALNFAAESLYMENRVYSALGLNRGNLKQLANDFMEISLVDKANAEPTSGFLPPVLKTRYQLLREACND